jgi:uncharacterized protein (TIGR03437 family)
VEELVQNAQKSFVCLASLLGALLCFSDTALAQNGTLTLTANPTQLTFSAGAGTISPQSILITSSAGATNVAVSATSANSWLQVSPTSGTTPLQVTVSVNPALSSLATDDGFINIVATGASLSVRVELDTLPGASPLSANPNSLSFPFPVASTVPVSKSVTFSSTNSSLTSFTATARTADGGNWLTINPVSGNISGGLQVTVNPTALPATPGPFSGAVAINAPGTNGISLPVLVTLAGTPAIQLGASQLAFAWQVGTNTPATQSFSITSSTGANVGFTAFSKTASCGSWLVISPDSGATPSNITASINTAGLTSGTTVQPCQGEIDITASTASNALVVVPVTLLVSTNPLLLVPATGPAFTYQLGTSIQPAAQNVQIASSGTPLAFTVTTAPTTTGGVDFVTVTPTTGTTPQSLAISVNSTVLASLAPGTYSDTVTLTSAGAGNSPQSFVVTLTVNSNPLLTATAQALTFNYEIGKTAPTNQTFNVMSTASPLNFQVAVDTSNCSGFLSATAVNGATGLTYQEESQVVASVNVAGLTKAQVCNGHITLSVPGSSTPALSIPVTLNVSATALLDVSTNYIYITALAGANTSSQTVSVTSTDSTVLPFTATAATNPVGLPWLSVAPNGGNTPNNLSIGISPQTLGVGGYDGTITVTSDGLPAQLIHVHLQVVASNVSATPPNVSLTQSVGGAAATQTIQISGVPAGTTIGTLVTTFPAGGTWLQASASGNTVTVTAGGPNLLLTAYSGVVTVIVPGAGNSPLYIPVNLAVNTANTLAVSVGTVNFGYQIGSNVLQGPALVQVTASGGSVPITAAYTPTTGGNIVTVTPTTGNTPVTLSIALNTSILPTLGAGTYAGNVVVSSPNIPGGSTQMIKVNLTVTGPSAPAVTSLVNGASFLPGAVSPGELISIFGSNLGPSPGINFTPSDNTVGTTLGDTTVTFNGVAAPLIYAGPTQINAIVPYEIGNVPLGESINVIVNHSGIISASFSVAVTNTAPGIFSANQTGIGQGAILNSNESANNTGNPAPRGSTVSIYATGEGLLIPPVPTGSMSGPSLPLPAPAANVSVTIGGAPATISYAGEAPTLVSGVIQVNVAIPADINPGNQPVVLTIGNNSTKLQAITVAVQ